MAALLFALRRGGIQVQALWHQGGTARLVVDDPERTLTALGDFGIEAWLGDALGAELDPDAEAFERLLEGLADSGVGVEAAYSGPSLRPGRVRVILSVSDLKTALGLAVD